MWESIWRNSWRNRIRSFEHNLKFLVKWHNWPQSVLLLTLPLKKDCLCNWCRQCIYETIFWNGLAFLFEDYIVPQTINIVKFLFYTNTPGPHLLHSNSQLSTTLPHKLSFPALLIDKLLSVCWEYSISGYILGARKVTFIFSFIINSLVMI